MAALISGALMFLAAYVLSAWISAPQWLVLVVFSLLAIAVPGVFLQGALGEAKERLAFAPTATATVCYALGPFLLGLGLGLIG